MKKYGNKIIAILLTAVCLCGILPLIVYAKTEIIYYPPIVAITEKTRYSGSQGAFISENGNNAVTVPLPIDKQRLFVIEFGNTVTMASTVFFLNDEFGLVSTYNTGTTSMTTIQLNVSEVDAAYVTITVNANSNVQTIKVNDNTVEVAVGSWTLATPERYEEIEVPDDTEDVDIVNNVLTMWQKILTENLESLGLYYNELTKPIALIIGIPTCIAICGIIFCMLGGKKR